MIALSGPNMLQPAAIVLFVDDDLDVRKTAGLLLKKVGYLFWSTATPGEAMIEVVPENRTWC